MEKRLSRVEMQHAIRPKLAPEMFCRFGVGGNLRGCRVRGIRGFKVVRFIRGIRVMRVVRAMRALKVIKTIRSIRDLGVLGFQRL